MLDNHPNVFLAPQRETKFFTNDHIYLRGIEFYETNFFHNWSGQAAVGEKTPEYLLNEFAAQRIHSDLGTDIKLIVMMRSPAARAHSGYRHNLMMRTESLTFEDALASEATRIQGGLIEKSRYGYLERGRYATQIERYLSLFPRNNILFLRFDELVADLPSTGQKVFDFLGIESSRSGEAISEGKPVIEPFVFISEGDTPALRFRQQTVLNPSPRLVDFADNFNRTLEVLTPLNREQEFQLNRTHFAEDIRHLEDLSGWDLSAWMGQ